MQIVSIFANPPFCIAFFSFFFFFEIHRLKNTQCTIFFNFFYKTNYHATAPFWNVCIWHHYKAITKQKKSEIFIYLSLSLSATIAHTLVHIHKCTYTQTHKKLYKNIAKQNSLKTFQPVYHCHRRYVTFFFSFSPLFQSGINIFMQDNIKWAGKSTEYFLETYCIKI